jgi:hypothetical protein
VHPLTYIHQNTGVAFQKGVVLAAGYGLVLWLSVPLRMFRWIGTIFKVGGLLSYKEKALRLAWEDCVLVLLYTTYGSREMICCTVISHAQRKLFWSRSGGMFGLECWPKADLSVLERTWSLCIDGISISSWSNAVLLLVAAWVFSVFCRILRSA